MQATAMPAGCSPAWCSHAFKAEGEPTVRTSLALAWARAAGSTSDAGRVLHAGRWGVSAVVRVCQWSPLSAH